MKLQTWEIEHLMLGIGSTAEGDAAGQLSAAGVMPALARRWDL
jgi:hypothetical protein